MQESGAGSFTGRKNKHGNKTTLFAPGETSLYLRRDERRYWENPKHVRKREDYWETAGAILSPLMVVFLEKGGLLEML